MYRIRRSGLMAACLVLAACLDRPTAPDVTPTELGSAELSNVSAPTAPPKTSTGFYLPTNVGSRARVCGSWLGRDRNYGGCYLLGFYHIGLDIPGQFGSAVFAIASGTVLYRSNDESSWGKGNSALYILHTLRNGSKFVALYGHITTSLRTGDPVRSGAKIGGVGRWSLGDHLHFGIRPGSGYPGAPSGRVENRQWPEKNDFVDPWTFIWSNIPR